MKTRLMVMAIRFPARVASRLRVLKMGYHDSGEWNDVDAVEPQHHGGERPNRGALDEIDSDALPSRARAARGRDLRHIRSPASSLSTSLQRLRRGGEVA
jgi:hypothetical protein